MKNFILLISFILIQQAFASVELSLTSPKEKNIFTAVYSVSCENRCYSKSVFKRSQEEILKNLESSGIEVEEYDIIFNPNEYEITDLLELDFSGADGDEGLNEDEIQRVLKLTRYRTSRTAIMGIITSEGVSEYLFIYNSKYKKLYTLKKSQYTKKDYSL